MVGGKKAEEIIDSIQEGTIVTADQYNLMRDLEVTHDDIIKCKHNHTKTYKDPHSREEVVAGPGEAEVAWIPCWTIRMMLKKKLKQKMRHWE